MIPLTDATILLIESLDQCPCCGDDLDSGLGFGMRDLECANEECAFTVSYPADDYRRLILDPSR
jgi:hypothetical protein